RGLNTRGRVPLTPALCAREGRGNSGAAHQSFLLRRSASFGGLRLMMGRQALPAASPPPGEHGLRAAPVGTEPPGGPGRPPISGRRTGSVGFFGDVRAIRK